MAEENSDLPDIVVNGKSLSPMQAVVVLVAVEHFLARLDDPAFMRDRGRVGPTYRAELAAVRNLMRPQ